MAEPPVTIYHARRPHPKHPERGNYTVISVEAGRDRNGQPLRRVEVGVSPSGRSARVWVDGVEAHPVEQAEEL